MHTRWLDLLSSGFEQFALVVALATATGNWQLAVWHTRERLMHLRRALQVYTLKLTLFMVREAKR